MAYIPCRIGGGVIVNIPNGKTVTPTDDIQTWLHCAGIFDNNYTTLAQVLNDTIVYEALLSDANACDYMTRSTSWAYAGLVPKMTSDTMPSGVCLIGGTNTNAYYTFDGNKETTSDVGYGGQGTLAISWYQYKFDSAKRVKFFDITQPHHGQGYWGRTFKVQYSNDGTNFTDITDNSYTMANEESLTGFITKRFEINEDISALYWRIQYLTSYNNVKTLVSEIQFYSDVDITTSETAMRLLGKYDYACDKLLSNATWASAIANSDYWEYILNTKVPALTADSANVITNLSVKTTGYEKWHAFDGNTGGSFFYFQYTASRTDGWVGYDFGAPVKICKAKMYNVSNTASIKTCKYQYSDDGTTWVDATETITNSLTGAWTEAQISSSISAHRYWCAGNLDNNGDGGGAYIPEIQFYGRTPVNKTEYIPLVPIMTSDTTPSGVASAGSVLNDRYAYKAFDGIVLNSCWTSSKTGTSVNDYIQYKFDSPVCVNRYRFAKPSEYSGGTFKRLLLQGSNTGGDVDWETIDDHVEDFTDSVIVSFNNTESYLYYRLTITATASTSAYWCQVGELQFYAKRPPEPAIIHCATDDEITIVGDDIETTIYAYGDTATLPSDIPSGLYTFTSAVLSNPSYPDQPYTQNVYITEHTAEIYFMPENMETILWTNSAPTSAFAAQNVTLSDDINNYKYIKISFRVSTSNSETSSVIMSVEDLKNTDVFDSTGLTYGSMSGNGYKVRDYYYVNNTSISFTSGYQINYVNTDNNSCIPVEITGLNKLRTGEVDIPIPFTQYLSNGGGDCWFVYHGWEDKYKKVKCVSLSAAYLQLRYYTSQGATQTIITMSAGNTYDLPSVYYDNETSLDNTSGIIFVIGNSGGNCKLEFS